MDKEIFIQSINNETVFNNAFFKKVFGYSMYDPSFLTRVASALTHIGGKDIIALYNQWYQEYKVQDDKMMKDTSQWYQKECDKQYQNYLQKVRGENGYNNRTIDYQFTGFSQDW
ncbi:hypothetical protein [Anaerosporobacter sp.]